MIKYILIQRLPNDYDGYLGNLILIDKDQQIYFQNGQKYNYGKNYCVWIGLERK